MPNKATAKREAAIAASGETPLDYMLNIMRGQHPKDADAAQIIAWESMRFEAAKAAAPYVHPRMSSVEVTGKDGGPVVIAASSQDERL